jgi:hypothetical protein
MRIGGRRIEDVEWEEEAKFRGEGGRGAESYDHKKALSSISHSILFAVDASGDYCSFPPDGKDAKPIISASHLFNYDIRDIVSRKYTSTTFVHVLDER